MDTTQKIKQLIAEKKFEEAGALIKEAIQQPMTEKERGDALMGSASMYLKLSNMVSQGYKDALKEAIQNVKALNATETKVKEKISLAEVREILNAE